ncbi:putative F-box protein At1g67623 [Beta vulgaris subsp. vulgaris]|uniref:putative F-box protein At1g67623 n=1 Tax=Beta vulgaris subsp. vulgaris TaxID=3555 RepID=UPI0025479DDC|nr:putative F-box protein At1g67623 [Beta vulgaris subsp. vulgaris]
MDPKIAKHVNDINESMMEFFEAWSAIDEQIANSLKALEKLEEEEEMETMGYVGMIISFRNKIELATMEAKERVQLTCKAINKLSHDEKIYKKVSFEHLYMRSLRNDENKAKFFDLCLEYKNPEALLRYGMVQYFTYVMLDEGLKNIDLAHSKGNVLARYLLGLLLIFNADEERKKRGVALLLSVFHKHPIDKVVQLRETLRDMMVSLWLNNTIVRESDEFVKCDQGHLHEYDNIVDKWDYFAWGPDDLKSLCDAYLCNREAAFFLRLLH